MKTLEKTATKNNLTIMEFNNLFVSFYAELCLFANKHVNDMKLAEDIVQNVFIKVWKDKPSFKKNVTGFLYNAVRNKSLDFLRSSYSKRFKAYPKEKLEELQTDEFFIKEAVIIESSSLIQKAINSLNRQSEKVIRLSMQDYTNKEIAEELGIALYTVKEYKKAAYKKLRKSLINLNHKL